MTKSTITADAAQFVACLEYAANLLQGNHRQPDYHGVPSVAFTVPPIAAVGLSEAAAREQGRKFRLKCRKASDWFTARQAAEPTYGFKVLVEDETDCVLGAHLSGRTPMR